MSILAVGNMSKKITSQYMKTFIVMHFTYNSLFRFATIKNIYNNL